MENCKSQGGFLQKSQSECVKESPRTNTENVIIVVGSAKTDIQKPVAAILVATAATTTTNFVVARSQCDGR